jgi:cytochrome c
MCRQIGRVAPLLVFVASGFAHAQTSEPAALDGEKLFKQQCSACHSVVAGETGRQGPNLSGVYGRKPGSVEGFHYSAGYAKVDFLWDEPHLDAYLANPQAVIPGSIMPYRQSKAPVRTAIVTYLKEQK